MEHLSFLKVKILEMLSLCAGQHNNICFNAIYFGWTGLVYCPLIWFLKQVQSNLSSFDSPSFFISVVPKLISILFGLPCDCVSFTSTCKYCQIRMSIIHICTSGNGFEQSAFQLFYLSQLSDTDEHWMSCQHV